MKSGGYLIIDQTEAMTTIDVNTGAYVGHRTLEETIYKTNLEAAQAIARQLRLRNLGGIIIIDFIDMHDASTGEQVMLALEKALDRDPCQHQCTELSPFGLIEMTRKRTTESLGHVLCEPCEVCTGRGAAEDRRNGLPRGLPGDHAFRPPVRGGKAAGVGVAHGGRPVLDDQSTTVADLEERSASPSASSVKNSTRRNSSTWCYCSRH